MLLPTEVVAVLVVPSVGLGARGKMRQTGETVGQRVQTECVRGCVRTVHDSQTGLILSTQMLRQKGHGGGAAAEKGSPTGWTLPQRQMTPQERLAGTLARMHKTPRGWAGGVSQNVSVVDVVPLPDKLFDGRKGEY